MDLKNLTDSQGDKISLIEILSKFASEHFDSKLRTSIFKNAGIEDYIYRSIEIRNDANQFAEAIVAHFDEYRKHQVDGKYYYPLGILLIHLRATNRIDGVDDQALVDNLIRQGKEKTKVLTLRQAIGRIELDPDPKPQNGIGTGTLVASNLLLTCKHIFPNGPSSIQQAWVRFNYTESSNHASQQLIDFNPGEAIELCGLDYSIIKLNNKLSRQCIKPVKLTLNRGQDIRLIHHPRGEPVKVSELGEILQVGNDYIYHNLKTDDGSSGAPIFAISNQDWQLVAIHRGDPESNSSEGREVPQGAKSGIPIHAFFDNIQTYQY